MTVIYDNPANMTDRDLIRLLEEIDFDCPEKQEIAAEIERRGIWIHWRGQEIYAWGYA